MKIGGTIVLGALISLLIIGWLYPLNPGAIALVTFLSLGVAAVAVKAFSMFWKWRLKK